MSRRHRAERREVLPDPKFGDLVISRFTNSLMYDGKRSVAESIVYGAIDIVAKKAEDISGCPEPCRKRHGTTVVTKCQRRASCHRSRILSFVEHTQARLLARRPGMAGTAAPCFANSRYNH